MNKSTLTLLAALLASPMYAQTTQLGGFYYGQMQAPTGWEWQSPDSVAYNKQQPHAWFVVCCPRTHHSGRLSTESGCSIGQRIPTNVRRTSIVPILTHRLGTVCRFR